MSRDVNPPGARRMALIALLSQNTGVGLMFGSFGPLIASVEAKLHVGRDLSSLGMPLVILGMSLLAPVAGALSSKVSLRTGMMAGAVLSALGYAALASSGSIVQDLLAYGLLIGPGLALIGTVLPSTLVTRWFTGAGAGRALGLVNMPIFVMLTPFLVVVVLHRFGLQAVYLSLAAISLALLAPLLFVIDRPPPVQARAQESAAPPDPGLSTGALLASPPYLALVTAFAAISSAGAMLVTHIAPMVMAWGLDATRAASLVAIMGGAGVAGSLAFGVLADRIGGGFALAVNCADQALLWALLLTHPAYPVLLLLMALIGVHSGGIVAIFGVALSDRFGAASFGRGYGLSNLLTLPILVASAPLAAAIFVHTHSYVGALELQIGFFAVGGTLAALAGRRRKSRASLA